MWWKPTMPKHLPLALGPWAPGALDVMSGLGLKSSFFRLYYPTVFTNKENNASKWYKWSPHEKYIDGFAQLVNSWGTLIKLIVWFYGGEPMVPAMWEAVPLKNKKFPVIIFSHGFGATRFISATVAMELASWGFVVASIEHKENSASASYFYETEEDRQCDNRTWIPHKKMEFGPNHYAIRNEQLHRRMDEVKQLIDDLTDLNNGKLTNIFPSTSFNLQLFKDCLDLDSLCMMGHSFGGATSLLTMANDERLSCGVILDGWMFPLKDEDLQLRKPLIFINTQTFHIESNIHAIDKVVSNDNGAAREVFTIMHTTHETQTDTPHIMGYWLNWFMTKLDPEIGTKINNHLTLKFLHNHLGFPRTISDSEIYLEQYKKYYIKGTLLYSKIPKRKL